MKRGAHDRGDALLVEIGSPTPEKHQGVDDGLGPEGGARLRGLSGLEPE
jgi:hypothetical protein